MGYLILPALLESAFFTEATREMRAVLTFHTGARRDSLDMMGKAFQYGNYMRALELSRFVVECQRYANFSYCVLSVKRPCLPFCLKIPPTSTIMRCSNLLSLYFYRSTQLLLCKAELPLLEICTKHSKSSSALRYLSVHSILLHFEISLCSFLLILFAKDLMDNKLPESMERLDEDQLSGMVDHMDFDLVVRTDQLGDDAMKEMQLLAR